MRGPEHEPIDRLVEAVLTSSKYGRLCPDFIRRVGEKELAKRPRLKEAIKSTKRKLHQVAGAYLGPKPRYSLWLEELRQSFSSGSRESFQAACRKIMGYHASTRERLPILDRFYATILEGLPPPRTVLDVACGLNPLALPWMPLAAGVEYYAYDIDRDLMDFLGSFMALVGVAGQARGGDIVQSCPPHPVDLALVLKTLPGLEQVEPGAGVRLLEGLQAAHLLVSFPVRSLEGKEKGMVPHYEARFREEVGPRPWSLRRWEFATELAFLITK